MFLFNMHFSESEETKYRKNLMFFLVYYYLVKKGVDNTVISISV